MQLRTVNSFYKEKSLICRAFTVGANLLSIGTVVALASSGSYEIVTSVGSSDIRTIGVVYSLDRTEAHLSH